MKKTAERIKSRRIELGLSQQELADRVGLSSRTTIAKWESDTSNIRQSMIRKLAKALDCSPTWLIGLDDKESVLQNFEVELNRMNREDVERIHDYAEYLLKHRLKPVDYVVDGILIEGTDSEKN